MILRVTAIICGQAVSFADNPEALAVCDCLSLLFLALREHLPCPEKHTGNARSVAHRANNGHSVAFSTSSKHAYGRAPCMDVPRPRKTRHVDQGTARTVIGGLVLNEGHRAILAREGPEGRRHQGSRTQGIYVRVSSLRLRTELHQRGSAEVTTRYIPVIVYKNTSHSPKYTSKSNPFPF